MYYKKQKQIFNNKSDASDNAIEAYKFNKINVFTIVIVFIN